MEQSPKNTEDVSNNKAIPQTFSRRLVAVSNGIRVDVVVAFAFLAGPDWAPVAHRVAKIAIGTELAPVANSPLRALGAHGAVRHIGYLYARAAVGAGARLAVIGGSCHCIAIVAPGAHLTVLAICVVPTLAFA